MILFLDSIGWLGAVLLLGAYGLQAFGWWRTPGLYHGVNLVGASGLAISSLARSAYPAGALNLVWALVAVVAIVRGFLAKKPTSPNVEIPPEEP